MKKLIVFALFCLSYANLNAQANFGLKILARWDDDSLPVASPDKLRLQYSSCWGLTVNRREYAVVGGAEHVLFFDVTKPTQPKLVGKFKGRSNVVPREFKSYKNRVYAVADAGHDGIMIFDLSHAQDSIVRTFWDTTYFRKIHTIAMDTVSGRMYLNGGDANDGIMVFDVSQNPDKPVILGHQLIPGGRVHDCYVRNDTVYASSGNEGYYVFDFKNPDHPVLLAQISSGGYNHSSWLTLDGKYAYYTEEIPSGLPIHIVDLQNLALGEIELVGSFIDNLLEPDATVKKAIPHNLYIKGDRLYVSQYEDGLLVYDITDRLHPSLIAHYDTRPENTTYDGFFGNWGNYPWLPSGNIIASDMQNGLFILRMGLTNAEPEVCASIFPNPASDFFRIQSQSAEVCNWDMLDTAGRLVRTGTLQPDQEAHLYVHDMPKGCYFVKLTTPSGECTTQKVIVM